MKLVNKKLSMALCGCLIVSSMLIFTQMTIAETNNAEIPNGTRAEYESWATAAYRMYMTPFRITVDNNSSYPLIGSILLGTNIDEDPFSDNIRLEPYFVEPVWESGAENSPISNTTHSVMAASWDNTTTSSLNIGVQTGIYSDQERSVVELNYTHTYETESTLNIGENDTNVMNASYRWDSIFGVLVEYTIVIDNLNDSSLDGSFGVVLETTTLWGLETDVIPGYPLAIFLGMTLLGGLYVFKKTKNKGGSTL